MRFIKPMDLTMIESETEILLRKGAINVDELVLDKTKSSDAFIKAMEEVRRDGFTEIGENEESYDDFVQLAKFRLMDFESGKKFLLVIDPEISLWAKEEYKNTKVLLSTDFLSAGTVILFNEDKKKKELGVITSEFKQKYAEYDHIYYIGVFENILRNRAFNRLMKEAEMEFTMGLVDTDNLYLAGIKPGYTGCYECLEKHIITKFQGTFDDYMQKMEMNNAHVTSNEADFHMLIGLILKDMDNIMRYNASTLLGNVLHFYTPNFEYSFNANRRSCGCTACAKINRVRFDEQNMRSINILKEVSESA